MARYPAVKADPVQSRQRFEANPQGVGYEQSSGLIRYYDRILAGYEEDVTGEPATLSSTAQTMGTKAPVPDQVGSALNRDATNVGQEWRGRAYTAFHRATTQRATSISATTPLIQRSGGALETVSKELTAATADMQKLRKDFVETATRLAMQADLRAAEAPNPTAARVEQWKGHQEINKLGLETVAQADKRAKKLDTEVGKAGTELAKVEREAGGDTHNPSVDRGTPPAAGGDPIARLAYRNGFEDRGPEVRSLQTMLSNQTGPGGQPLLTAGQVTGNWDAATQRAVDSYLKQQNLPTYDPALADPSRLPPRFQALWPILERVASDPAVRVDPVYMMAILDRETLGGAKRGQALPNHLVGGGGINKPEVGGGAGNGLPQIDANYHSPFLESNTYGYDPETSVQYSGEIFRDFLNDRRANGDIHKAFNLYNSGRYVTEPPRSGGNYGIDTTNRARVFRNMLYGLDRKEPTAASPRPDQPAAKLPQAGGHEVNIDTLIGLRKGLLDNSFQAAEVVSWLRGVRVGRAAFGSRPSSEQTSDAFHRAVAAIANKLRQGSKGVAEIAETVTGGANDYRRLDEIQRDQINKTGRRR